WLYASTRAGAPRGKVVRTPVAKPSLATAETVLFESDAVISQITPTKTKLYTVDRIGGPSQIRVVSLSKVATKTPAAPSAVVIPPISNVDYIVALDGDDVLFSGESYVTPPAWMRVCAADGKATKTAFAETSNVDFGDVDVFCETCTSK